MARIAHIAALWSLRGHPSVEREWSLERKISEVARAGFDGIAALLTLEHRSLARRYGLKHLLGFISSSDPLEFGARLREQKEAGAVHINVQMDDHDTPPAVAVRHWLRMEAEARRVGGVIPALEVHRDTCTETPEKTYAIAEAYRRRTGRTLHINFDFSHFAVVKHLSPPDYATRLLDHPALVRKSTQCHFRPFNGHHCQVPVMLGRRLTPEAISYLSFAESLMRLWRSAPGNRRRTLFACPEMGPLAEGGGGYNLSGLPAAWPEAVALRAELDRAWRRAG